MFYICEFCGEDIGLELDSSGNGFVASGVCDECKAIINLDLDINRNIRKNYSKPNPIVSVEVIIDDNMPEYMEGILRIGSVKLEREYQDSRKTEFVDELVDNTEFHTEKALRKFVSQKLNVSEDIIEIIY